jgi:hypothetical protein
VKPIGYVREHEGGAGSLNPIAQELEQQIHRHIKLHGLFSNCLNSFDNALAESRLAVPTGQSSHLLRHTFASR